MAEKERRKRVWIHLRSGRIIRFQVRTFDADTAGGKINSYKWSGTPVRTLGFWRRRPLHIDPSEIVAIEVRGG